MKDNNKNSNFFAKLGHSLNLESKRYNNALKKGIEQEEGTSPITNTADLMSTESMDDQQNGQGGMGMEQQGGATPEQSDAMNPMNAPNEMNEMDDMDNGMGGAQNNPQTQDMDMGAQNIDAPQMPATNNDMEAMPDKEQADGMDMDNVDNDMEMNDMDNNTMDDADATLAATTVAKKHTAETKSMSPDQVDGLLRPIDVYETKNEIIVKAIVAGVARGAIKVSITPESVTISGERQKQERISRDSYFYQELFWGSFSRSIMLPVEVDPDNAKASLKDGIFTIRLPKIEQQKERILSMDDIEEG